MSLEDLIYRPGQKDLTSMLWNYVPISSFRAQTGAATLRAWFRVPFDRTFVLRHIQFQGLAGPGQVVVRLTLVSWAWNSGPNPSTAGVGSDAVSGFSDAVIIEDFQIPGGNLGQTQSVCACCDIPIPGGTAWGAVAQFDATTQTNTVRMSPTGFTLPLGNFARG